MLPIRAENLALTFHSEVLHLVLDHLIDMILKSSSINLLFVFVPCNHVLNDVYDFLVEVDDVWFVMDVSLNLLPLVKYTVLASSENGDQFAKHLTSSQCSWRWLFDSQDVCVSFKFDLFKSLLHILSHFLVRKRLWWLFSHRNVRPCGCITLHSWL